MADARHVRERSWRRFQAGGVGDIADDRLQAEPAELVGLVARVVARTRWPAASQAPPRGGPGSRSRSPAGPS